ncbi:MAG: Holliday junction resolvase RuvX [Gammaproteobacteria bacterium]|nr:Holliday junction resolvase RuvX [Gammaproteobacteria bacterium]
MTARTLLGFDYGTKHIGVAVGQQITHTATALETLALRHNRPDWSAITRLVAEWQPQAFLVGVPLNRDGSENPVTRAARRFGHQLHGRYQLPVHSIDERLSSHAAADLMENAPVRKARGDVDKFAAQIILQTWLNNELVNHHPGAHP